MKKLLPLIAVAVALSGCRTRMVTPEECWAAYGRYYKATGEVAAAPSGAVDLRQVKSSQMDATVAALKSQGYVVLGEFDINDDTDITYQAVMALASKLNAGAVVWCSAMRSSRGAALPNPDMGIVGIDTQTAARMTASRPDQSFAEQTCIDHKICVLGKRQ